MLTMIITGQDNLAPYKVVNFQTWKEPNINLFVSLYIPLFLSFSLNFSLSLYLSIFLSIYINLCLSLSLFLPHSLSLSLSLSLYLSIYLTLSLSLFHSHSLTLSLSLFLRLSLPTSQNINQSFLYINVILLSFLFHILFFLYILCFCYDFYTMSRNILINSNKNEVGSYEVREYVPRNQLCYQNQYR